MPITHFFKPESKLLISVQTGAVPDDEFLASYKVLFEDPRYDTSFNQLVDLRQADSSERSTPTLAAFADSMRERFGKDSSGPRIAVIAPKDLSFGLARMLQSLSDTVPWEFSVFRDAGAAMDWLGLPKNLLDDLDRNTKT